MTPSMGITPTLPLPPAKSAASWPSWDSDPKAKNTNATNSKKNVAEMPSNKNNGFFFMREIVA